MTFLCKNGHRHRVQYLAEDCATCRRAETRKRERAYAPIVPGRAKDDGTGRKSAYDTTWPEVHQQCGGSE